MRWRRWMVSASWLALFGCPSKSARQLGGFAVPPPDGTEIVCPVTKERCAKSPELESAVYEMRTFYFCRAESRTVFAENPERYAFD
jgi:YHS domain-containing protein